MKRLSKKEILKKKERDKQAVVKVLVGLVMIMALISWGAGLFAMGIPFVLGISLLPEEGETLKDKWRSMGKKQKGLFLLVTLILMPFILVGLMWASLIGSMIIIDLLVFFPIFLIVSWFIFRNPKNQTNPITEFLGSYYSLVIGIVLLFTIIAIASWNYYNYVQVSNWENLQMNTQMGSIVAPDEGGAIHFPPIPNGSADNPYDDMIDNYTIDPTRTHDVTIKVADILSPAWMKQSTASAEVVDFLKYEKEHQTVDFNDTSALENATINDTTYVSQMVENITLSGYGHPIEHAQVILEGSAKSGNVQGKAEGEKIAFEQFTDQNGIVRFKDVSEGLYILKVKALGYRVYVREFPVIPPVVDGRIYTVSLVPDYYRVKLHWRVAVDTIDDQGAYVWGSNYTEYIQNGDTYVSFVKESDYALSDAEIITSAFEIINDSWRDNLNRVQSMYGWLGVSNPNNPLFELEEHMLYVENSIYYQSMYANPTSMHNIYATSTHLAFLVIVGIVIVAGAVAYFSHEYTREETRIEINEIDFKITTEVEATAQSGYKPEVYIFGENGGAKGVNGLDFYYTIDTKKTGLVGNKDTSWYVVHRDGAIKYIEGGYTMVVWGKDVPNDATIKIHAQMFIHYHIQKKVANSWRVENSNQVYSDGLEDILYLRILGESIESAY